VQISTEMGGKIRSMASTAFSLESEEWAASVWIVSCHEHGHINSYHVEEAKNGQRMKDYYSIHF
jgi:hypothetical protein